MQNLFDFALATPEIVLLVLTGAVLLIDAFGNEPQRRMTFMLTMATLVIAVLVSWGQWSEGVHGRTFSSLYVADSLGHFLKILSAIAVAVTLIYGRAYAEKRDMMARGGEMYSLTLLMLLGEFVMISAGSMLTVYLGVELMSFALYALVALRRDHVASTEAAMKY
jgi:NADH-quinone oxidoreductase subunit N